MTSDVHLPISDDELDQRLRLTFETMMPLLDDKTSDVGVPVVLGAEADLLVLGSARRPSRVRWGARFAAVAAAAALVVGFVLVQRPASDEPVANNTVSSGAPDLPAVVTEPGWYSIVRPLLPDDFDRIALTHASPQSVGFLAFRSGSDQILDIAVTLQPGFDREETTDPDTVDDRLVEVRCGVTPIERGLPNDGGGTTVEPCADSSNPDPIDSFDLREIARDLASGFPLDAVDESFGAPVATVLLDGAMAAEVADFIGELPVIVAAQNEDVIREVSLSPATEIPATSRLTVVTGLYQRQSTIDAPATPDPPRARFFLHEKVATALVVSNGTAFHIATSDLNDGNLDGLSELLDRLTATEETTVPADVPATTVPLVATDDGFTLLSIDPLPDGYELLDASYTTGPESFGLARWGNSANSTELWLVMRNGPVQAELFESFGRTTWIFEDRTVWSDGERDGCVIDACSIGLQWDERTALSLMWVNDQGGSLAQGSNQDTLLALLPALAAEEGPWQEVSVLPDRGSAPVNVESGGST